MADSQRTRRVLSEQHRKKLSDAIKARLARGLPHGNPRRLVVDEQKLRELYVSAGMNQRQCADELGLFPSQVRAFLLKYGIPIRKPEPTKRFGADNHNWRGSDAAYSTFHHRVRKIRGTPKRCEVCGTTDPSLKYEWANLTGNYDNPNDFKRMCRPCHLDYDRPSRLAKFAARRAAKKAAGEILNKAKGG